MPKAIELLNDKIVRYLREMELNVQLRRDRFEIIYGRTLAAATGKPVAEVKHEEG